MLRKVVSTLKYRMSTEIAQKKLKLAKAGMTEIVPEKKARAFVSEVIVMDGPACLKACLSLCSGVKWRGV